VNICHKINGYGGLDGPDLTTIGRRLSIQELKVSIVNGGKNMPAFGGILKDDEMNKIIAFLKSQN